MCWPWIRSVVLVTVFLSLIAPKRSGTGFPRLEVRITPLYSDSGLPFRLYHQVQLRCVILTNPALDRADLADCGWTFESSKRLLHNSQRYTVYSEPMEGSGIHQLTSVLTIHGITDSELGHYTCVARNSAGMHAQASVHLELGGDRFVKVIKVTHVLPKTTIKEEPPGMPDATIPTSPSATAETITNVTMTTDDVNNATQANGSVTTLRHDVMSRFVLGVCVLLYLRCI